jgi:CheY-like chemotaxis protein
MDQPRSVLVVEDEPILRMDIVDFLEEAGYNVWEAEDAKHAIDVLVEHGEICLVLTDVDMPGRMDGLKLASYVRDHWPPLKIIVVSGYRQLDDDDIPPETVFFAKPYDPKRIVKTIGTILADT